jgi:hypothetical protein
MRLRGKYTRDTNLPKARIQRRTNIVGDGKFCYAHVNKLYPIHCAVVSTLQ